jgi:hypothetical protein
MVGGQVGLGNGGPPQRWSVGPTSRRREGDRERQEDQCIGTTPENPSCTEITRTDEVEPESGSQLLRKLTYEELPLSKICKPGTAIV